MPGRPVTAEPLRVVLLGLGTVGREVARALVERGEELARGAGGRELRLVAVGVREPERDRGVRLPSGVVRSDDLAALAARADADVVVELLGGLDPAGELQAAALREGRGVVTANKALLARRGAELEALAREHGAPLRFEAAVAGAIPVLAPLAADLAANRWTRVAGIVNGTTNFMLTAMADDGWDYASVLADAQARGYAEADPSGDVEGRDAADKLAVLARLAFGAWPDVGAIRRAAPALEGDAPAGITGITPDEMQAAGELGLELKLVAHAALIDGHLSASVVPSAVEADSALGRTDGVTNIVQLSGEPVGTVTFSGPGAGGGPTSSAVLGDLLAMARGAGSTWAGLPAAAPAGATTDGLDAAGRWFHVEADGSGSVTEPMSLAELRAELRERGLPPTTTLFPVLEEE